MSNYFAAILTACILGSCGIVPSGTAPRNLDNACSIVEQRPHYMRAFKATERRWGVPVNVQMAIIHQESRFKANAKTPMRYILGVIPRGRQSSAYGYAQALDGTWEEYKNSTGRFVARRSNIGDATDFMGWYMNKTKQRNGVRCRTQKISILPITRDKQDLPEGVTVKNPGSWAWQTKFRAEHRCTSHN